MKKTPVSSRPSLISASSGHVNKSRNATVKASIEFIVSLLFYLQFLNLY